MDEKLEIEPLELEPVESSLESEPLQLEALPEIQEPSIISELANAATGGAIGAGTGALLQSQVVAPAINKAAEKFGPYSSEQLNRIVNEYDQYKLTDPSASLKGVEDILRNVNVDANKLEEQAYKNLVNPITREQYQKAVIDQAQKFTKDVPTDTQAFQEQIARLQLQQPKIAETIVPGFEKYPEPEAFAKSDLEKKLAELDRLKQQAVKKLQTPLANQFPELEGKMITSGTSINESDLNKILNLYKKGDKLSGEEAYQLNRLLGDMGYDKASGMKNVAAATGKKALREEIAKNNPEASELFKAQSAKINELKDLEKAGYLKRDKSISKSNPEFVNVTEKNAQNIFKDLTSNKMQLSDDVKSRLEVLKKTLPEKQFKELELSMLKAIELDPKNALKIGGLDVALAGVDGLAAAGKVGFQGVKSAKGSIQAARLADLLSQFKGLTGKTLPGALGAVGATIGAASAANAGEISPQEASVLAPIEALNPTPLDTIEAYKAGKKEYEQSQSIPKAAVAAVKGSVQPLVDLGKVVPQIVDIAGQQRSETARDRMAKNFAAFDNIKNKKPFTLSLDEANNLLQQLETVKSPATETIKPIIKDLASGDPSAQGKADFLLQQDPRLRDKIEKLK